MATNKTFCTPNYIYIHTKWLREREIEWFTSYFTRLLFVSAFYVFFKHEKMSICYMLLKVSPAMWFFFSSKSCDNISYARYCFFCWWFRNKSTIWYLSFFLSCHFRIYLFNLFNSSVVSKFWYLNLMFVVCKNKNKNNNVIAKHDCKLSVFQQFKLQHDFASKTAECIFVLQL